MRQDLLSIYIFININYSLIYLTPHNDKFIVKTNTAHEITI